MAKPIDRMTAKEFDEYFDNGGDVSELFDGENVEHPNRDGRSKQISITLPVWLVDSLDEEAERRGVARKAVINTALVEWTDELMLRRQSLRAK